MGVFSLEDPSGELGVDESSRARPFWRPLVAARLSPVMSSSALRLFSSRAALEKCGFAVVRRLRSPRRCWSSRNASRVIRPRAPSSSSFRWSSLLGGGAGVLGGAGVALWGGTTAAVGTGAGVVAVTIVAVAVPAAAQPVVATPPLMLPPPLL